MISIFRVPASTKILKLQRKQLSTNMQRYIRQSRIGKFWASQIPAPTLARMRRGEAYSRSRRRSRARRWRPGYSRTAGFYGRFRRGGARQEYKFKDTTFGLVNVASTGTVTTNMVVIPEGDGEQERDGRKITVKSISVRGLVVLPAVTAIDSGGDLLRLYIVQDMQTNGLAYTPDDVMETTDINSFRQLANSYRFKILATRKYRIGFTGGRGENAAIGTWAEDHKFIDIHLNNLNIPIIYDNSATTGNISTQRSNSINILMFSHDGLCNVELQQRIRFSDG